MKVTKIDLENSHPISEEIYNQKITTFTDEFKDMINNLNSADNNPRQIKRVLLNKSKKKVTIQRLKNLINQIAPKETDDAAHEALEEFLGGLEEDGGDITWRNDPDETMKVLFITSRKMKSAFRACDPPLVQLDTSFEFVSIEIVHWKISE